jgi:uncharacterized protein (TIGR03437 family)
VKNSWFRFSSPMVLFLCGAAAAVAQGPRPVIRYANALGGSGQDGSSLATTDAAGNVYLVGTTASPDFPVTVQISNSRNFLGSALFVVKIDPSGSSLLFSTIVGGAAPGAIAVDSSGSVYVAGVEAAAGYPTTAGAYSATGNCFVSKLDPSGASLVYSTKVACDNAATISALAVDRSGNAYLAGWSSNSVVTTPGAYRTTGFGAFALKLNPTGSTLMYSTFLPGTANLSSLQPRAMAVDAFGSAYIAGSANILSFQPMPDTLPHETYSANGGTTSDAMVLKLSPDGSTVVFASLFGGTGDDVASAIYVGTDGTVYVSGASQLSTGFQSLAFPTTPGAADTIPGFPKGFVARLTPDGDAFLFSTFLSGTWGAPCLSVTDAGVDLLANYVQRQYTPNVDGAQIMRVSTDGTALVNSSLASASYLIGCGQNAGNFVALGSILTSPNLSHIGSKANIGFSLISADDPGVPQLDVNTGEINLIGWRAADGTFPAVQQVIHVTANGQSVPVAATANGTFPVTFDHPVVTTPADITVSGNEGGYEGEVILFAPGAKDGLVRARFNMTEGVVFFTLNPSSLQFTAGSGSATPTPMSVHVSTEVVADAFGTVLSVPLNYSLDTVLSRASNSSMPFPSWLSAADTGTSPEDVIFTANPAGLADGLKSTLIRLRGAGPTPTPGFPAIFSPPLGFLNASLRVGPAPPLPTTPVTMTLTPPTLGLRFTDPSQQQQSVTVHITTSADPMAFTIGQLPPWLTASPSSGQTPADVTLTVTPPVGNGFSLQTAFAVNAGSVTAYGQLLADVTLPGYVGPLFVQPVTNAFPAVGLGLAPGSLFYIQLNEPEVIPGEIDPAGAAVFSLAGYSFAASGTPIALIAYQSGQFLAQMPVDAQPGTIPIDALDSSGTRVATGNALVTALMPDFFADQIKPRAQKADGTTIDATNPVAPGDAVLMHVTGLGLLNPPLATGQAASADTPSVPVAAVSATIGGKSAQVISAQASESAAGVVDIWLTTPNLYEGDHYISVGAMGVFTSTRVPIKVKNP